MDLNERSKRWQLTENNAGYTKQECAEALASIAKTIYVVSCEETGESGTKHVHAFIIYENAISLKTLHSHFPRAHFEHCKGSNIDNRAYVCKDDKDVFESGSMPLASSKNEGKKDIASEVVNLMNDGISLIYIMREYPSLCEYVVKNYRSLREIEKDLGLIKHSWR